MRWWPRLLLAASVLGLPASAGAQVFFSATPAPDLRIGPLMIRGTITPEPGPARVRILWGVMREPGGRPDVLIPDVYLLMPGEVSGNPALGPRDADLAREVTDLGFDITGEGRLTLRGRHLNGSQGREEVPGGASYVTFVQAGGTFGLSPPATWIRIPSNPKLSDPSWLMELEIPSQSLIKPKPSTWLERWVTGERRLASMSFNEARGRPLFRMYLTRRDRVLQLAEAPAEMALNFSDADRLKIDTVYPPNASRGLSETLERTEVISQFLETSDGVIPQRLTVQYGYFSRTQGTAVVVVPLVLLVLGYAVGPLVGRVAVHVFERLAGRFHVGRSGVPRERRTGVVIPRETLSRIRPGETTYDEVLRLCGSDAEVFERYPSTGRRTLVYRGQRVRPQMRRLIGWLSAVRYLEVERHDVTIEFEGDVVADVRADIRRSRVPVGEKP
jgi:hypothetical protein